MVGERQQETSLREGISKKKGESWEFEVATRAASDRLGKDAKEKLCWRVCLGVG